MSSFQSQAELLQQLRIEVQQLKARVAAAIQPDSRIRQTGAAAQRVGVPQTHPHTGTGEGGPLASGTGFLHKLAASYEHIQSKLDAAVAPTTTDDSASGYAVGSIWIDVTADKGYLCLDATATAAVWTEITQAGGGGGGGGIAYRFRATRGTQSIPNATWTKVEFNSEDYDPYGDYDHVTNYRYTAPVDGRYVIAALATISLSTASARTILAIYVNGARISRGNQIIAEGSGSEDYGVVAADVLDLAANDYIEIFIYHDNGASRNLSSSLEQNHFAAHILASGGGGHTIRDDGVDQTARTGLNFIGPTLAVTDDAGDDEQEIRSVEISRCFITNATGVGEITGKTYEANTVPANKVLTAFESDDDDITLTVEIHAAIDAWMPASVQVTGAGITPVTILKQNFSQLGSNHRVWTASVNIPDADTTGTLTATMADGDTAAVSYTRALDPPQVLTLIWDDQGDAADPYPAAQTQFKNNDNMQVSGTAEAHADEVYIIDYEATSGQGVQGPYTVTAGVWTAPNVKAGSATGVQNLRAYAKVTGGSNGPNFTSPTQTDHSQTVPTFTGGAQSDITYPGTQEAIKDAETCSVLITHTNPDGGDTYLYDDNGTPDLVIPSPTVYAATKTGIARDTATYRESGTNYRLTATRTAKNGASATKNSTVKIAHTMPTVTVGRTSGGAEVYRFGSGSGTKDHTVYLISTQANLSTHTPVLTPDAGDDATGWQGSWATDGDLRYTRSYRIVDADIDPGGQPANDYSWASCSIKNRAGKEQTAIGTNLNYELGGFSTRTLDILGGTHVDPIGVPVVNTSRTTVTNQSKGGAPSQTYEGSVTEHEDPDPDNNNYWTTVASDESESFDDYTQFFHCSDKLFYDTILNPNTFEIQIGEAEGALT